MKTIPTFTDDGLLEINLDLDGVFADFDNGVYKLAGKYPHELGNQLWKHIYRTKDFFLTLELMPDAQYLWEYFKQYQRKRFLTGAPSSKTFQAHKPLWVKSKLCELTEVVVLPSKDKHLYSGPNKVLIDDRAKMIDPWVAKGGFGILHTGDVWATIEAMEEYRKAFIV